MASETELRLPVLFRAGTQTELVSVDPQEPEHTWRHRAPAPASSAIESPAPLVPVESSGLALPILLALAAALAAGAASMRRGVWRVTGVRWLTVLVAASLGAIAVRTTIRDRSAELPPDAAIEVFELLHRGVYGAFDGADESAIYRRLAAVAVEELCGELYGDVFESLVLRSKGGAFCRIDRIEYLDERHVADPAGRPEIPGRLLAVGAPTFDVHCRWRVDGVVAHWGHEHRRVNEYDAVYVVAADRGAWKLAAVRVLDHRRLDRDD